MSGAGTDVGPRNLDTAVLRIWGPRDLPVGAGFLVTGELAFTCAHVVTAALGTPKEERPPDDARIRLDLPLSRTRASVTARVHRWAGAQDIAVLRLDEPLPGARPVRLVRAAEVWHHPMRAFGFPVGRGEGVWHSGRLLDRQGDGWIQTEMTSPVGYRVSGGFSGGPVWDDRLAGVVGMVVAAETKEPAAAYLIPADELLMPWPELELPTVPESPFRPLAAFGEADARYFFGRAEETAEVAGLVRKHEVVTLVGPSGSGKSSLAMAGVVPRLRESGYEAVVLRPASSHGSPLTALADALLPLLEPGLPEVDRQDRTHKLAGVLESGGGSALHSTVTAALRTTGRRRLLLVVDQCEEALAVPAEEIAAVTRLLSGEHAPEQLRVLLTLRADFLEPALADPSLGPLVKQRIHALRPMDHEQLREVIERPVHDTPQVSYDGGLADRILRDTGDAPGALPLLVMALDLLWREQTAHGRLTHEAYERTEGVTGALRGEAERVWAENVREAEEPAARRLFTRLVRVPVAGAGAVARRPAVRSELAPGEWEIAQRLAATRLLVAGGGESVELAHEALITGWPKLAGWVAEDHEFLAWRETVRLDMDRWRDAGKPAELLPAAVTLATAQRWLGERADDIGAPEREFLEQGSRRRRSSVRRRRGLFSVLGLISVLALVLGVLFGYQREVSAEQQAAANSRALASLSADQRLENPALAVKLALAAYRTSPTDEARNTLLRYYAQYRATTRILSGTLGRMEDFRASLDGDVMLARTPAGRATLFVHALGGTAREVQLNGPQYAMNPLVSGDGKRVGYVGGSGFVWYDVHPDAPSPVGEPRQLLSSAPELTKALFDTPFAQLSYDGRLLAAGSGMSVAWWDLERGALGDRIRLPQARGGQVRGVWFGPDADTLVVLAEMPEYQQRLMVVDRRAGTARVIADSFENAVVSGDGRAVAICRPGLSKGGEKRGIYTGLRIPGGSTLGRYEDPDSSACDPVALGPRGRQLVLGITAKTLVDLPHGTPLSKFEEPDDGGASMVSHARLVGSATKPVLVTGNGSGIFAVQTSATPAQDMLHIDLTPDGRRIVTVPTGGRSIQLRSANLGFDLLAEAPRRKPYWEADDPVAFGEDATVLAQREGVNTVVVREAASLRRLAVITTALPPTLASSRLPPALKYFFDGYGHLVTLAGSTLQRWDARTGHAVDDYDLDILGRTVAAQKSKGSPSYDISGYPAPDRVTVVVRDDPYVRVLALPGGRVATRYRTSHADLVAASFDPRGRYFAVLRKSQTVELWGTDPVRKTLGPLSGFDIPGALGFLATPGRYMIASNNKIRAYRIDERGYDFSYDLGPYSELSLDPPRYYFLDASRDGRTLLFYRAGTSNVVYPLKLRPDDWADALCRLLGGSDLGAEDRRSQLVAIPAGPLCP